MVDIVAQATSFKGPLGSLLVSAIVWGLTGLSWLTTRAAAREYEWHRLWARANIVATLTWACAYLYIYGISMRSFEYAMLGSFAAMFGLIMLEGMLETEFGYESPEGVPGFEARLQGASVDEEGAE